MTWITSAQLTERRKQAKVTFAKRSIRCTDCNNEAQRRSRVNTGKRQPTMIGG